MILNNQINFIDKFNNCIITDPSPQVLETSRGILRPDFRLIIGEFSIILLAIPKIRITPFNR